MYGVHIKQSSNMLDSIKYYYDNYKIQCIQFFLHSPTQRIKTLSQTKKDELQHIKQYCNKNNIQMFVHAPYTINISKQLTNPKSKELDWWIASIIKELKIADSFGINAVVLHVGKSLELETKEAISNMYISLQIIVKQIQKYNIKILLETSAGQGTELLYNMNDYLDFYKSLTIEMKKKIFLCLDTCHMFSAGNDVRTKKNVDDLIEKINDEIGINSVHLIHLNDSKMDFFSRRDRHESLGKGYIGDTGLRQMFNHAKKNNIPVILEGPGDDIDKNLLKLKSWC